MKKLFKFALIIIGVLVVLGAIGSLAEEEQTTPVAKVETIAPSSTAVAEKPKAEETKPVVEETKPKAEVKKEEPAKPTMTMSQQNAVREAESYLRYTAFSRKGLIEQLEFGGFSNTDAVFAVDSLNTDWNEQAAIMAQDYIDYTSFSRQALIDQLVFSGFTKEQAEFGVKQIGY